MSADLAIQVSNLTKLFGRQTALDNLTIQVPSGSIFGFLGPNGAGKSTTLNILAGLSKPTSGSATIFGQDVAGKTAGFKAQLGYLPDVPGFYPWMTGRDFLRFAGKLFGIEERILEERAAALLDLAGLAGVETRISGYSRGMRQRLGIAQALINAPKVLLLDEPTSALDPVGRKEILDMIASLSGRTTIFFSTHILADVERVCDTIAIIDQGRLLIEGDTHEIRNRSGSRAMTVELNSASEAAELAKMIKRESWLVQLNRLGDSLTLSVTDLHTAQLALPRYIADQGFRLRKLETGEASLEDIFVDLVGVRKS